MNSQDVRDKHKKHLLPAVANFYEEPVVLHEGAGMRVRDLDGREYLDFFGGILTVSVGHGRPEVNEAIVAQVQRLTHVSTLYPTVPIVELAEKLATITPGALEKCFFTASGTEADETAVMLAQTYTGNQELVTLRHGYSGRSALAQAMTSHAPWRAHPTQVTYIKQALSPYCYRCPFKLEYPSCGVPCAKDIEELIQTTTVGRVAGMLAEPIQGVGGFIVPPKEYYEIAASIVRKYGGVFISDEVQTGFGRTGKWWGIEHFGVEPDMMTMAKGIANGMPLGACIVTGAIADSFTKSTLSTFGGNPVSCAAANATIGVMEKERLADNAEARGQELREGLLGLKRKYPKMVGDVRGMGLMQAIELVVDETVKDRTPNAAALKRLLEETKKRNLLIGKGGLYGNVVRISPPLVATADDVAEAVRVLDESLGEVAKG